MIEKGRDGRMIERRQKVRRRISKKEGKSLGERIMR